MCVVPFKAAQEKGCPAQSLSFQDLFFKAADDPEGLQAKLKGWDSTCSLEEM